ncbi:hypothetical protein HAX54_050756 [Datura stramonium]|uniref:Uncharacterized protein n=1 Tax=Datura stramonium TaxID=4076 RepID=A0ABS8WNV5_DATST|nr:hypothetical protein [Datura stramonium]
MAEPNERTGATSAPALYLNPQLLSAAFESATLPVGAPTGESAGEAGAGGDLCFLPAGLGDSASASGVGAGAGAGSWRALEQFSVKFLNLGKILSSHRRLGKYGDAPWRLSSNVFSAGEASNVSAKFLHPCADIRDVILIAGAGASPLADGLILLI